MTLTILSFTNSLPIEGDGDIVAESKTVNPELGEFVDGDMNLSKGEHYFQRQDYLI